MPAKFTAALPLALLISACGSEPAVDRDSRAAPPASEPAPAGPATAVAAAAAKPINLGALGFDDIAAAGLQGELGCGFMTALGGEELWIGQGDVDPRAGAQSVVKVDGDVVKLTMEGKGGYDVMADGARFAAGDLSVAFVRTGSDPLVEEPGVAMESAAFPAQMSVRRGDSSMMIEGVLECGP